MFVCLLDYCELLLAARLLTSLHLIVHCSCFVNRLFVYLFVFYLFVDYCELLLFFDCCIAHVSLLVSPIDRGSCHWSLLLFFHSCHVSLVVGPMDCGSCRWSLLFFFFSIVVIVWLR